MGFNSAFKGLNATPQGKQLTLSVARNKRAMEMDKEKDEVEVPVL